MRAFLFTATTAMVAVLMVGPARATVDCTAAQCAAQSAIANCGCPDATNHGAYVSCVAHAVNNLARQNVIATNCKGKVTRCAARSTCGKPGFVVCQIPTEFGTCDTSTTPGTCSAGTSLLCDGTCSADTDCAVSTKCKIKSSADRCTNAGGVVDCSGATTCCAAPTCP
jgi:hypothetical protein